MKIKKPNINGFMKGVPVFRLFSNLNVQRNPETFSLALTVILGSCEPLQIISAKCQHSYIPHNHSLLFFRSATLKLTAHPSHGELLQVWGEWQH